MAPPSWRHHTLLQALLSCGALPETDFHALFTQVSGGRNPDCSQDSLSRLPTSIANFSLSQKEKTLNELIRDGWLSYTSTGKIGLGIWSFLDLRSWFCSNDIPSCEVCNEAGIKASTCPNEGCNLRIHEYCLKKKISKRKASRACPSCGTEWPWPRLEGEGYGDQEVD